MAEIIEDSLGELDLDMISIPINMAHWLGYRKVDYDYVRTDHQQSSPYEEWVWLSRYIDDEEE